MNNRVTNINRTSLSTSITVAPYIIHSAAEPRNSTTFAKPLKSIIKKAIDEAPVPVLDKTKIHRPAYLITDAQLQIYENGFTVSQIATMLPVSKNTIRGPLWKFDLSVNQSYSNFTVRMF